MSPYTSPVSELLTLGVCDWKEWADYSRFEFSDSHIPELLQLAKDWALFDHDDDEMVYAPVHAWRVLGILQAEQAVDYFVELLKKDDETFVISEYLPSAFGRLGAPGTVRLWEIALNAEEDEDARDLAIESLSWNGIFHKDDRDETVKALQKLLGDHSDDETYLNTAVLGALLELEAKESIDVIHEAYQRGKIDREVHGDFEDVEVELGIKSEREIIPDWRFDEQQRVMLEKALAEHSSMSFREVEGLLFSIWGSPQPVPPTRWLKIIFGDSPEFQDEQLEKNVHRCLFNLMDTIERDIEMKLDVLPKECHAEKPEGEAFEQLQLWSRGFTEGNALLVNFWEEVFSHKAMKELEESWTACTILLSVWANPERLLERAGQPGGPNIEKMLSAVPSVVRELSSIIPGVRTRWKAVLETPEPVSVNKVGRNDPCPCGSGKKYKKCCGA